MAKLSDDQVDQSDLLFEQKPYDSDFESSSVVLGENTVNELKRCFDKGNHTFGSVLMSTK